MLKKQKRVTRSRFAPILKEGRTISNPLFSVRFIPNETANMYAVVVSKAVIKSAVGRNQLRRRMYAIIGDTEKLFRQPFTYVFFMKKESAKASFAELKKSVTAQFSK